ncbi:MAG: response regulator transcription factor [Dehalococcoidales bacterium]|nr:response regulator transcription factor [Dehalococcoidales bacterium]
MTKILIADDHGVVREGLKRIIAKAPDLVVAGEAETGEETLEKALTLGCDMVLLDITMPGRNGFDVMRELRSRKPELRILMLSMHPEEQYAVRALRAGASGYLNKDSAPQELMAAIQKVALGGRYISSSLAETIILNVGTNVEESPHESLSDREYQVLCMIGSGKAVKQIADELMLGAKTISTYRQRILEKMKMSGNAELIRYAILNRLVD